MSARERMTPRVREMMTHEAHLLAAGMRLLDVVWDRKGVVDPDDVELVACFAICIADHDPEHTSDMAARLGMKGGKRGGPATAAAMTPAERSARASKAARARWERYPSKAQLPQKAAPPSRTR